MSTNQDVVSASLQSHVDARLDAIDRLLLGALPRNQRLALMGIVEDRLKASGCSTLGTSGLDDSIRLSEQLPSETLSPPASLRWQSGVTAPVPLQAQRRSKLALCAGLLGILACALLLLTPVSYLLLALIGSMLDETLAIGVAIGYVALIAAGGLGAILLGCAALWRLRRHTSVRGRGWAIVGLCAAPVPLGLSMLALGFIGLQFAGEVTVDAYSGGTPVANAPRPMPYPPEPPQPPAWLTNETVVPVSASGVVPPPLVSKADAYPPLAAASSTPGVLATNPAESPEARPGAPALPTPVVPTYQQ